MAYFNRRCDASKAHTYLDGRLLKGYSMVATWVDQNEELNSDTGRFMSNKIQFKLGRYCFCKCCMLVFYQFKCLTLSLTVCNPNFSITPTPNTERLLSEWLLQTLEQTQLMEHLAKILIVALKIGIPHTIKQWMVPCYLNQTCYFSQLFRPSCFLMRYGTKLFFATGLTDYIVNQTFDIHLFNLYPEN